MLPTPQNIQRYEFEWGYILVDGDSVEVYRIVGLGMYELLEFAGVAGNEDAIEYITHLLDPDLWIEEDRIREENLRLSAKIAKALKEVHL